MLFMSIFASVVRFTETFAPGIGLPVASKTLPLRRAESDPAARASKADAATAISSQQQTGTFILCDLLKFARSRRREADVSHLTGPFPVRSIQISPDVLSATRVSRFTIFDWSGESADLCRSATSWCSAAEARSRWDLHGPWLPN